MTNLAKKLWTDESGQGLAEYALLLGLIVVGVVVIIKGMGGQDSSGVTVDQFAEMNRQEYERFRKLVRDANIKGEGL